MPGLGRSPGEEKGYPLMYSGLENSMDCIVHGIAESDMPERLSQSIFILPAMLHLYNDPLPLVFHPSPPPAFSCLGEILTLAKSDSGPLPSALCGQRGQALEPYLGLLTRDTNPSSSGCTGILVSAPHRLCSSPPFPSASFLYHG